VLNFTFKLIRLYNVLRKFLYLSTSEEPKLVTPETEVVEGEPDANLGLNLKNQN